MKAAYYTEYGAAADVLRVGDLPDPEPGPGEVRVRVHFSGINPSDCNRRRGIRDRPGYPLIVPHSDGAGVIDRVGAGVDLARVGERVWLWNVQRNRAFGSASELVALPSAQAVRLPDGVSLEAGACLGVPAMTAYYSLFADGDLEDLDVLVTGGAGAVGHYAVQFARLAGAGTVVTTVSGEAKAAHVRPLRPDAIVNYRSEDVADRVLAATAGRGVDRISEVDFGGNLPVTTKVIREGTAIGAYASHGDPAPRLPFYPLLFRDVVVRFLQCYAMPARLRAEGTATITRWATAGLLAHAVGPVFSLDRIVEAHEAVEAGRAIGNVLVEI